MPASTNRIEKEVLLKAPIERVWRALSDAEEFGTWFGVDFSGQKFEPGGVASMKLTEPPEYAGLDFTISIVAVEPPRRFSFRWHPYAVEPAVDYSNEPTTLVEFTLQPEGEETRLRVVESGFDQIPAERRSLAFRMNEGGWEEQMERIRAFVDA